jgi:ABC-type multidrug transport system fused ATPase/permease subunit
MFLDNHLAKVSEQELYRDKILQKISDLQVSAYDRAQAYDNFIVTLGYAGAFAIWTLIKDLMSAWDMKLIALLLGVSLFFFITWTVAQMLFVMRNIAKGAKVVRGIFSDLDEHLEAINKREEESRRSALRFQRFWPYFFVPALVSGFGAILILLSLLLADLLGVKFSVESIFHKIFLY